MDYESFLLVRSIFHSPSYNFATKCYKILLNATSYHEMPTKVDFNQSEYKNFLVSYFITFLVWSCTWFCSISTPSIVVGLWIRFASLTKRMLVVRFVRDCHSYPPEHVIKIKSSSLTKNQLGVQISRWRLLVKPATFSCIAKVSRGFELSLILQCFVVFS